MSSKILTTHKDFFSNMAVDAVLRLKSSGNLEAIQITKVRGGTLEDSFLDEGFLLNKKPGVRQPKKIENAKILIGNTPMDTDKIKVFGSRVKVDAVSKVNLRTECWVETNSEIKVPQKFLQNPFLGCQWSP